MWRWIEVADLLASGSRDGRRPPASSALEQPARPASRPTRAPPVGAVEREHRARDAGRVAAQLADVGASVSAVPLEQRVAEDLEQVGGERGRRPSLAKAWRSRSKTCASRMQERRR